MVVARYDDETMELLLHRNGDVVIFAGDIGGITFKVCSPSRSTHALLLVGLGCGLKEDERFRPLYEAMKQIVEETNA